MKSTMISANSAFEGKFLFEEIEEYMNNENNLEDLKRIHKPIYTPKEAGVVAEYNIRTDRFAVAQNAMDIANRAWTEKQTDNLKKRARKTAESEGSKRPETEGQGGSQKENQN